MWLGNRDAQVLANFTGESVNRTPWVSPNPFQCVLRCFGARYGPIGVHERRVMSSSLSGEPCGPWGVCRTGIAHQKDVPLFRVASL